MQIVVKKLTELSNDVNPPNNVPGLLEIMLFNITKIFNNEIDIRNEKIYGIP